jgi:hypothetical protein
MTLIPTDASGIPIAVATAQTTPITDGSSIATNTPATTIDRPPITTDTTVTNQPQSTPGTTTDNPPSSSTPDQTPPPAASTAPPPTDTPTPGTSTPSASTATTDAPPPVADNPQPPDTPSTTDTVVITIFYKTSEDVLQQSGNGSELPGQTQKLLFATPDLPGSGANKAAQDIDFDRDPAQGKSGPHGTSTIAMHPADLSAYGLADFTPGHYRADVNLLRNSGVVADTTGRTVTSDVTSATAAGGHIVATTFKIGDQTMTRLEIELPYGANAEDLAPYTRILGAKVVIDYCRTTKPSVAYDDRPNSPSALNHEVAQATLRLDRRVQTGRAVR